MILAEICDNATKGREYALLGNYDSSAVYYQGVLQQIHKHCQSLRDPALKVQWQQVTPHRSVREMSKPCVVFNASLFPCWRCTFPLCCEQVRTELTEEYKQVKAIVAALESFKSAKPRDNLDPQLEERPEDPAVWPPPIPSEHRCVFACARVK